MRRLSIHFSILPMIDGRYRHAQSLLEHELHLEELQVLGVWESAARDLALATGRNGVPRAPRHTGLHVPKSVWQVPGWVAAAAVAQGCMSHICIAEGSVQRLGREMSLSEEADGEMMYMLQAGNPATVEWQTSEQRHQTALCSVLMVWVSI